MNSYEERKELLLVEMAKLHSRHELAQEMGPDFFEPGVMEFPEQFDGNWDENTGEITLCFEARGTRYNGRTEQIEKVHVGDGIQITRDPENEYNRNNFLLLTEKGKDVGNMPAELCNVVAPLYDDGSLVIEKTTVSYVEPISQRSRHAKQAVLFVEMHARLIGDTCDTQEIESNSMGEVTEDPYILKLDLSESWFSIGNTVIKRDTLFESIKQAPFMDNATVVQDPFNEKFKYVFLRHVADYLEESWVIKLNFENDKFTELWLEHVKLMEQRSLLRGAANNPRLRKNRASLYSKLKVKLNDLIGTEGELKNASGNQHYMFAVSGNGVDLVLDNNLPSIILCVYYPEIT